jgi:hypothetical protein
MANLM